MNAIALTKVDRDGIEFYTLAATGESGVSQSGLAILCGVSQQAISKLEKTLTTKQPPEWLEPFVETGFTLTTEAIVDGVLAGNLKIYTSRFCIATINHYAGKGNKVAVHTLTRFAEMGFTKWVQDITGWQSAPSSHSLESQITLFTTAIEQALTPIASRLEQIEQRLNTLPSAKPKRPWTLPASTPPEEIPDDYQQLDDGSWLSPEAYQSILKQGRKSLQWEVRKLKNFE